MIFLNYSLHEPFANVDLISHYEPLLRPFKIYPVPSQVLPGINRGRQLLPKFPPPFPTNA